MLVLLCAALAIAVTGIYAQVGTHQFLNLDDNVYLTANPHVMGGLTGANVLWSLTSVEATNWHPVTWLSHMADAELYGMDPRGHHLTNVAIHILSTLLLLFFLFRATGDLWPSFLVAALFALHPLHVESVAWAAERKDVLSAFFWFLTLFAYCGYVATLRPVRYLLTLFCFGLGLMSKPMLVTLPLVLLLLDWWPLGRYRTLPGEKPLCWTARGAKLVREKLPFFLLSLGAAGVTVYAQHEGEAMASLHLVPFTLRMENALVAYVTYLGKTLWPRDLAVFYPYPSSIALWQVIGSLVLLLLISAAAVTARRRPYIAVGWFWFLGTLVPVIGLLQVGAQSMADRYSYIPIVGLFIVMAWGAADLSQGMKRLTGVLILFAGVALASLSALTWRQIGFWQDNFSLYQHALEVTSGGDLIHNNLGSALASSGNLDLAMAEYREALRLSPAYMEAHYNLGMALGKRGDLDAAIREYQLALVLSPGSVKTHINLGSAFAGKGNLAAAAAEFRRAVELEPARPEAHYNLAVALAAEGDLDGAIREYRETVRMNRDFADAYARLSRAQKQQMAQGAARD